MSKKVLVVVDVQNDFITGSLGSEDAVAVLPAIREKVKQYANKLNHVVIFTRDTHGEAGKYLGTHEGKLLPILHCEKDTHGWEVEESVHSIAPWACQLNKSTFGYPFWAVNGYINDGDKIEVIGFCTDICVVTNALALRTAYPESNITVDAACCAGTSKEAHEAALTVMRSCQIEVINDDVKSKEE